MTEGGGTFVEATDAGTSDPRTPKQPDREIKEVRATDIEPYTGLRYLSKLFRFMAVILVMLLIAEIATGLYTQGTAAVPTLLGEASRLIVLAGVLWGTGDLAHLLIDVGHDVRAGRVMLARQTYHIAKDHLIDRPISVDRPVVVERVRGEGGSSKGGPPIP
jgi:hypothetical protein